MPLLIEEEFLPATLTAPPMTNEQFAEFCADHPDYFIEMTAEGEIVIMPPNYTLTGIRNLEICGQLRTWARQDRRGIGSEATTGFVLPSGARRSPDAAWTSWRRIQELPPQSLNRFWRLCPDFVIDLRSHWDRLATLRDKLREWIENGAQLGWLIDPERRAVEIYRPGREPEILLDAVTVAGEGPVEGFILDLSAVWNPLGQ